MKCRRSKTSPGARLRGGRAGAARPSPVTGDPRAQALPNAVSVSALADSASVLRIDGQTEGSVNYAGTVSVGPQGAVVGDIYATAVFVEGAISGDVHAAESLHIAASATIVGDMYAPRVAVVRGAQLRGNITMRPVLTPPSDLDDRTVDTLLSGGQQA